ncbi:GNAT family N-acetyltransferase [Aestuariimicrobium ganziense]|uniref:GNAT family N-acetyltransferase n=1 Tax=Aestuariimicrobium ganziense TaxID=2773677 RepID=UPI001942D29E|nr:GNAT family N-acetyltransferase [Aestuariimicrobium ganziense]
MATRLRVLGNGDLPALLQLTAHDPVAHLFVRARTSQYGIGRLTLGCEVLGFERQGRLVSVLHHGSNLVMAGDDPEAVQAFVAKIGPRRHTSSIMGRSPDVRALWEGLTQRWGQSWGAYRDLRPRQPLMVMQDDPTVPEDPRVRRVRADEFEAYFDAAVKMYTEEVGVTPLEPSGGYASYVRGLIAQGRAFGIVENGRVLFKSDIGTAMDAVCQVQGVWLDPSLRGRGLSEPAMASVVRLCRENHPVVSLYVNDFNTRARKLYERVGFDTVDEFATVLY